MARTTREMLNSMPGNELADGSFGQTIAWLGEHEWLVPATPFVVVTSLALILGIDPRIALVAGGVSSGATVFGLQYASAH